MTPPAVLALRRMYAMVLRHLYLFRKSWIRVLEMAYWPTMQMVLWGFIAKFLATNSSWVAQVPGLLVSALLLWEVLFRGQLGVALYRYSIFDLGVPLVTFFANLLVCGWAIGLMVAALVMRYGLAAENFAWGAIFVAAPVSGIYYPISVLPDWLQAVAWCLPTSHVFEGMRAVLLERTFLWREFWTAVGLNVLYVAAGIALFLAAFNGARRRGMLLQIGE